MCEHTCLAWVFTFVLPSVTPRLLPGLPHCLSPETPLPSRLLRVVASLPLFLLSKPRRPVGPFRKFPESLLGKLIRNGGEGVIWWQVGHTCGHHLFRLSRGL
jgi:hypothetical protein